jgi:gliding motility-associated-like protein
VPSAEPCKDPKVSYSIPNVITANGDGLNDQFKLPDELVGSRLIILNRWGSQVYSNDAYKNDWSGGDLTTGVYYYTCTISKGCLGLNFKGLVTILR